MKLSYLLEHNSIFPLKIVNPEKEYVFTCSLENALKLENDFIFIPIESGEFSLWEVLEKIFSNSYCKGFLLNKSALENNNVKINFHSLMKKGSKNLEVLLLVQNVYNFAYYMAVENSWQYNFETIAVVGTNETETVRELLVNKMQNSYNITYPKNTFNVWQKFFEPFLLADRNTDYVITEIIPQKPNLVNFLSNFRKRHVLFTKSSVYNIGIYQSMLNLSEELLCALDTFKNVKSIFTYMDNELINHGISYKYQAKTHFIKTESDYIQRCNTMANEFLSHLKASNFEVEPVGYSSLYKEFTDNKVDYFILNREKVSVEYILKSLDNFFEKYKDNSKIVVFEHIQNLGNLRESVYNEIFTHIAKLNPDILILLNTNEYIHLFKKHNQTTYVKSFQYNISDRNSIDKFNMFMESLKRENHSIYVAACSEVIK